jgi:hypothetical protein
MKRIEANNETELKALENALAEAGKALEEEKTAEGLYKAAARLNKVVKRAERRLVLFKARTNKNRD